ncbi:hypothetical protein [Rubripirellula lacrimiformis]|uniref:hypothetical protein n=1 Tax=Rubripirellula lacrimiformis TaxID=1930273 RepID=UPI001C54E6CF|nr:hypothetical protein [Rubripirellula lacrimiformis]
MAESYRLDADFKRRPTIEVRRWGRISTNRVTFDHFGFETLVHLPHKAQNPNRKESTPSHFALTQR